MKMEINETEKIAIARPVASRPRCPIYKSFSELLAGAINTQSTNENDPETAITAIRPKTVRLKPATNHALVGEHSSQADMPGAPVEEKSKVLYKPTAKLAPRKDVSRLGDKGSSAPDQQREIAEVEAHVQPASVPKTEPQQSLLAKSGQDKRTVHSAIVSENTEEVEQSLVNTSNADRPSYDGYNWRKYGQKQVKGSEFPRSYYKCTHLKCPVKKKVERSHDGHIAEIVYRGEHNHPKPQLHKRGNQLVCNDTNIPAWSNQHPHTSQAYVSRTESQNFYDPVAAVGMQMDIRNFEDSGEGSKKLEADRDEPKSKRSCRSKVEGQPSGAGTSRESVLPYASVQNTADSDTTEDGFRWRKYGQKVVKGNSYPRSYYKCTNPKCTVRKFVERTTDDPNAFITTYEGKHNHGIPNRNPGSEAASKTSSKASASKDKS